MTSPVPVTPTKARQICTWNIGRIVADLGGPASMLRALDKHHLKVPAYDTVLSWRKRNSLPAHWAATLVLCLALERKSTDVTKYISDGNPFR